MKLYFSPLACSLSVHIIAKELDISLERVEVDTRTQRTETGADYRRVNPLGLVPALALPGGETLTENAAILQYLGNLRPEAGVCPGDPLEQARLHKWLSFTGTELHKLCYAPLLDEHAPDAQRDEALRSAEPRLAFLAAHLANREFLLDSFSVADAYMFAVLNWSPVTPIDLELWPALSAYVTRMQARPRVGAALADEVACYCRRRERSGQRQTAMRQLMARFNDVFLRRNPSALGELIANDCVIENTDGTRSVGKAECVALWSQLALDPELSFELENVRVDRDSATVAWRLRTRGTATEGINLMRVQDGRIVEARSYQRGLHSSSITEAASA